MGTNWFFIRFLRYTVKIRILGMGTKFPPILCFLRYNGKNGRGQTGTKWGQIDFRPFLTLYRKNENLGMGTKFSPVCCFLRNIERNRRGTNCGKFETCGGTNGDKLSHCYLTT